MERKSSEQKEGECGGKAMNVSPDNKRSEHNFMPCGDSARWAFRSKARRYLSNAISERKDERSIPSAGCHPAL
ncbi:MAG: hypothetical protein H7A34_03275 [bacterium]|nr:hypothetical protein [bacterium]